MYRRKPAVAGTFYPEDPDRLRQQILGYLNDAEAEKDSALKNITGVISPHAGYVYSGPVAAYGYSYLKDCGFDGFVVTAPSHRARFDGASVIPEGEYATPLGDVHIDSSVAGELIKHDEFTFIPQIHEAEHSLEVQVPFIQVVKPEADIVPVIIGTTDEAVCSRIGQAVAEALLRLGKNYGIIVSTDLSHYHSYGQAVKMDRNVIDALESGDSSRLNSVLCSGRGEACGAGAVFSGMEAASGLGADRIKVVKYANSGDTAGPKDQVVGYLSALFIRE